MMKRSTIDEVWRHRNHFDHHQKGYYATFDDQHKTKMSSAGLVYE